MTRKLRPRCSSRLAKKLREGKGLVRTSETRVSGDFFLSTFQQRQLRNVWRSSNQSKKSGRTVLQFAAESSGQVSAVRACQSVPSCGAEQRVYGVINQD